MKKGRTGKVLEKKSAALTSVKDQVGKAAIMILTDHNSLTVSQMTKLRNKLWDGNAQYHVVKNTIMGKALEGELKDQVAPMLNGPTSIIFGYGDVVSPAKALSAFIKENEKPAIKCGVLDGKFLSVADIKKLASLPSREVLLAKVVGGIQAPLYGLVNVLQGPIRKLVYGLKEIEKKKGV